MSAKNRIFLCLWVFTNSVFTQNYQQIKTRFDNLLNYHGGLNKEVEITPDKIVFYNPQKQVVFTVLKDDWQKMAVLLKTLSQDSLEKIYSKQIQIKDCKIIGTKTTPKKLNELRIIIDPGHIAGNMAMARTEQKFLHFTKQNYPALKQDSVDIAEGVLTFQTAFILKKMLEEKGITVALTRKENGTSFGCTYDEWLKNSNDKKIKPHTTVSNGKFFTSFFKDHELKQRAKVINDFKPDMTIIIHYNVDEKNTDWKKPSNKDYCMTFIPGCFTSNNIETISGKLNLLRLLLTDDLDASEKISGMVVKQLSKQLNIPIAKEQDASYLSEHCLSSSTEGVYSRNLALCRMVQTPLVYGECLYQDSENECYALTQNTETIFGIKTNKRVILAAQSFYDAIIDFYTK